MSPAQRVASSPYPRRPSAQPKSSRQQFSACGACRMRRVRCDLKDLTVPVTGPNPACSNCKERGLKCVDEFADVKAVKLLRRGRRLQQVEAIYGKAGDQNATPSSYLGLPTRLPSTIPPLQPEFFSSAFWHWFSLQRPALDPVEFTARFCAHVKGSHSLGPEGSLLAMLLVVWAASFGVDEYGVPIAPIDHGMASASTDPNIPPRNTRKATGDIQSSNFKNTVGHVVSPIRGRKERSEAMLREVLELVDIHAVIRRPTWDGVRVLLLILPLLEDVHPLDRLTLHEASLSQVHSLCNFAASASGPSSLSHSSEDAITRARIFWYAYMQEGITTGMRGGRLVLNEEDLEDFQAFMPPLHGNSVNYTSGLPSPTSPTFPPDSGQLPRGSPSLSGGVHPYFQVTHLFSIPLRLSAVCRKVHSVLTSKRAARRVEEGGGVDAEGMKDIWDGLETCWEEFESLRRSFGGGVIAGEVDAQVEKFVSGWQIFIFECHNIIRESLKQYTSRPSSPTGQSLENSSPKPFISPYHLHDIALRKCFRLLPCVLSIIKHNLTNDMVDTAGLFKWDAGLVRDGCFFAAFLSASIDSEQLIDYATREAPALPFAGSGRMQLKRENTERNGMLGGAGVDIVRPGLLPILDADEGTRVCLAAIGEMRWALAKSEEREETIRAVWEDNKMKGLGQHGQGHDHSLQALNLNMALSLHQPYGANATVAAMVANSMHAQPSLEEMELRYASQTTYEVPVSHTGRHQHPVLPPLSLASPTHSGSAPNTACTDGSASGWPSYTPPSTAASGTSAGTGVGSLSGGGSPVFTASASTSALSTPGSAGGHFKGEVEDMFYHRVVGNVADFDQFGFNSPAGSAGSAGGSGVTSPTTVHDHSSTMVTYHQAPRNNTTPIHSSHPGYLDFNVSGGSSVMVHSTSSDGCAQFPEDCHGGYYH